MRASVNAGQTYLLRLTGQNATADIQLSNQVPDADRLDVSRDGIISGIDALRVINELLNTGVHATPLAAANTKMYLDTNLDGRISAVDVLQVINYLLAHPGVPSAVPQAATGLADPRVGRTSGRSAHRRGQPDVTHGRRRSRRGPGDRR